MNPKTQGITMGDLDGHVVEERPERGWHSVTCDHCGERLGTNAREGEAVRCPACRHQVSDAQLNLPAAGDDEPVSHPPVDRDPSLYDVLQRQVDHYEAERKIAKAKREHAKAVRDRMFPNGRPS